MQRSVSSSEPNTLAVKIDSGGGGLLRDGLKSLPLSVVADPTLLWTPVPISMERIDSNTEFISASSKAVAACVMQVKTSSP